MIELKIGIDLLWVKPNNSGGIESYIRNLLDGFMEIENKNEYVLILAKDNHKTFDKYLNDERFNKIVCDVKCSDILKRIIWQNLNLNRLLKENDIRVCFEPVYSKPIINDRSIKYITTIHDLQALHYPEYFSKLKYYWLKYCWKRSIKTSYKIIAISNFVKNDIIDKYKAKENKIEVIYNPIKIDRREYNFNDVKYKFNIEEGNYYYTVAQLLPHKNLITIIKVMKYIKENNINLPNKLLITGINGKSQEEIINLIREYNLEDNVVFTGYIDDYTRNCLYSKCKAFLFPSVFEGFGMPPVEAMILGSNVVTTKCTSILEVTRGEANYVEDPYDIKEWVSVMLNLNCYSKNKVFHEYNLINVANKYLDILEKEVGI